MKTLYDAIYCANSIEPQSDSGSTITGITVDTKGFNSGVLRFRANKGTGTTSIVVSLEESDTAVGGFAPALDNTGAAIGATIVATDHAAEVLARIEGLGLNRKRYLHIKSVSTLGSGAVAVFGEILLGNAFNKPVNTAVSNT